MDALQSKRIALLSEHIPDTVSRVFENLGYGCVSLPSFSELDAPVAAHPDMLFFKIEDKKLLCDQRYYKENAALLSSIDVEFVFSKAVVSGQYPNDIAFDVFSFDGVLYGKLDFIAPEIRQSFKNAVNVKQGYTKCSTLLTDRCAITADQGIYARLKENGVNVIKISPSGISLPGYGAGFIGGASAYDHQNDTVVFFGDLSVHPDCDMIRSFLIENGHKIISVSDRPLTDYGGAILIN